MAAEARPAGFLRLVDELFGDQPRLHWAQGPQAQLLKEMMAWASTQLVAAAAGRASRYYTRRHLWEIEAYSPFRFSALDRQRRKLARRRLPLMRLIEAFAAPGEAAT